GLGQRPLHVHGCLEPVRVLPPAAARLLNRRLGRGRIAHRRGPGNRASLYSWRDLIEPKDVVVAILGASAALAGFVLVFLGVIIASYESYTGSVPEHVVQPYRTTGSALLGTFGFSLVTVAFCLLWLINGGSPSLYGWTIGLFAVQLVAVFGSAAWATRMVLWR